MKSIVISIDEDTLERIDLIARSTESRSTSAGRRPNRSRIIRRALQDFVIRHERRAREDRDRRAYREHRDLVRRQAAALVREQAKF